MDAATVAGVAIPLQSPTSPRPAVWPTGDVAMLQHNPIKADDSMEALKIAVTCIIAAVVYGIVHDQFTAESVLNTHDFHPPLFPTQSPTLLGHRMGNHRDLVGCRVFRRVDDPTGVGLKPDNSVDRWV
jgi:hypothetical protein